MDATYRPRGWKIVAARGVVAGMALTGTYVPSTAQWVRDQVAEYEASNGERANTLRDTGYPIVVASLGGAPQNPEWYHNLVAHPEVELQDGAEKHVYTARILEGEERADWWQHAVATWPTYASYQEKTDREIPLFLLERA
jgi:deazaflavin-dependent oxidoreductase (nitroreductase family)